MAAGTAVRGGAAGSGGGGSVAAVAAGTGAQAGAAGSGDGSAAGEGGGQWWRQSQAGVWRWRRGEERSLLAGALAPCCTELHPPPTALLLPVAPSTHLSGLRIVCCPTWCAALGCCSGGCQPTALLGRPSPNFTHPPMRDGPSTDPSTTGWSGWCCVRWTLAAAARACPLGSTPWGRRLLPRTGGLAFGGWRLRCTALGNGALRWARSVAAGSVGAPVTASFCWRNRRFILLVAIPPGPAAARAGRRRALGGCGCGRRVCLSACASSTPRHASPRLSYQGQPPPRAPQFLQARPALPAAAPLRGVGASRHAAAWQAASGRLRRYYNHPLLSGRLLPVSDNSLQYRLPARAKSWREVTAVCAAR